MDSNATLYRLSYGTGRIYSKIFQISSPIFSGALRASLVHIVAKNVSRCFDRLAKNDIRETSYYEIIKFSAKKLETPRITSVQNVTAGVPQGSLIGPIMFLVYTNDIPSHLDCSNIISYAMTARSCCPVESLTYR